MHANVCRATVRTNVHPGLTVITGLHVIPLAHIQIPQSALSTTKTRKIAVKRKKISNSRLTDAPVGQD